MKNTYLGNPPPEWTMTYSKIMVCYKSKSLGSCQQRRSFALCTPHQWTQSSLMSKLCRCVPNWTQWMAAMGCRWEAVKIRWSAEAFTADRVLGSSMLLHMYRWSSTPPPPDRLLISVSGCAAADPSLLETRRELMIMSQLPPPETPPRHMTFCAGLKPLL